MRIFKSSWRLLIEIVWANIEAFVLPILVNILNVSELDMIL